MKKSRPPKLKKPALSPQITALYFNLAAEKKVQPDPQEQRILRACMEAEFPQLKQESRRLDKMMPTQGTPSGVKKVLWWVSVSIFVLFLAFMLLSCEWIQLSHTEDFFRYPGSGWRGLVREIDLTPSEKYYYFLRNEWQMMFWQGPTRLQPDVDMLSKVKT